MSWRGAPANNIARWNGAAWSPLDGGVGPTYDQEVLSLAVLPGDRVAVAGPFTVAGGQASAFWAVWQEGACYANCDCSSAPPFLNVGDFACFMQRFAAGDPYANCDGSTTPPVLNAAD